MSYLKSVPAFSQEFNIVPESGSRIYSGSQSAPALTHVPRSAAASDPKQSPSSVDGKVLYDFSSYGLDWRLTDKMTEMPAEFTESVWNVFKDSETVLRFTSLGGEEASLQINKSLAKGSYGEVSSATSQNKPGVKLVVKTISLEALVNNSVSTVNYLYDVCVEVLIQILIYETTKELSFPEYKLTGPFTPKIYYFGTDGLNAYIVSEQLPGSLQQIVNSKPPQETLSLSILQTCKILEVLYSTLGFSHRDLKSNNILYKTISSNLNIRVIDFGYSCAKLNGNKLMLKPSFTPSKHLHFSESITRDMHSLLYTLSYVSTLDPKLHIVNVMKAIISSQIPTPAKFGNSYMSFNRFNNQEDLKPKNLTYDILMKVFSDIKTADWASHLVKLYDGTHTYMTHSELEKVNKAVFEEYLTENNIDFKSKDLLFFLAKTHVSPNLLKAIISRYVQPTSINAVNRLGNTALILGADKLNAEFVGVLLQVPNCKTAIQNMDGNTALHRVIIKSNLLTEAEEDKLMDAAIIAKWLLDINPILLDIKNNLKRAPIDRMFSTKELIVTIIESYRNDPTLLKRRQINTNKQKGGTRGKKTRRIRVF